MTDKAGQNNPPIGDISALVDAFGNFNEAASSLNVAYRRLEEKIEKLTLELEEKDRELYSKLREIDRVSRYLQSVTSSISSAVVAVDMEGNISLYNNRAAELVGVSVDDAMGKKYEEVFNLTDEHEGALKTLFQGPELRGVEKKLKSAGTVVEVNTNWIIDSTGDRVGVVEVFDDVTNIRRMEERFEQQKTLTALGEMASAVAHELRNPLAGIGGFAAILNEELEGEPERQRLVEKLLNGVKDLEKVAGNLLFLTRRTELRRNDIDLKILLSDLLELLTAETKAKKLEIELTSQIPEEDVMLSADGELLKMVLTNLGRNAIIALEGKGRVEFLLRWNLLNNKAHIEVEDNGCGIDKEDMAKLFNPFFTTRSEGTGLGLALVKKAVDLHKGQIFVESEPGKGTMFSLELPIRPYKSENH